MPETPKKNEFAEQAEEVTVEADPRNTSSESFPVIGLGGSAGSFLSFEKFFSKMPTDSGMSFVVIMHLDPNYRSHLDEVFQRFTGMPVSEAVDGVVIEPNKVYLIPRNKDMGIHNRRLLLMPASKNKGVRQPIDFFLQSLADDQWGKGAGVIFSGMGSDGETGIRMLKEKLGVTLVQDPMTAEYDSMPRAAIGTGLVDFVLAPEEMPNTLIRYMNHPALALDSDQERFAMQTGNAVQKVLMLLRSYTGNDFAQYKMSTITRRIDRRIAYYQLKDYDSYVDLLNENPQEIKTLFNELLIGVTKFFRDEEAFDRLKLKVYNLLKNKSADDPIRVWIAGCSTGEEAYSIAMIIMECQDQEPNHIQRKIQIYATDLDQDALEYARAGVYHSNIAAYVSPERLKRFFTKRGNEYIVNKHMREMIVFAQQNIIKDAPFIRLDLVCCRNMLIYFTAELQKRIIPLFYYALNPGGLLLMGPAETIGGFTDMFLSVDHKWKLFERIKGNVQVTRLADFPFNVAPVPLPENKIDKKAPMLNPVKSANDFFNQVLIEHLAPAAILVDRKGTILFTNGKTDELLSFPSGQATMNIHKMIREELRYPIDYCISQTLADEKNVAVRDVKLKGEKSNQLINLRAVRVEQEGMQDSVLLIFEKLMAPVKRGARIKAATADESSRVSELERELLFTRQRLNNTIEQMESSMEELKSTNEELQSTNEELQSTNEESLTTKEEMQSLNEELMTINVQYQSKAEELTRLNNDMKNLLDVTEIGTIFLDNNLIILRYTPQVKKLFNLISTDVGRPIMHVVDNFEQSLKEDDIREVIEKLTIKEIDMSTYDKEWYRVRIMPYRTSDNFISGAVITFTLITDFKLMQSQLNTLKEYADAMAEQFTQAMCRLDRSLSVTYANRAFFNFFEVLRTDVLGKPLPAFLRQRWQTDAATDTLNKCISTGMPQEAAILIPGRDKEIIIRSRLFDAELKSDISLMLFTIDDETISQP
ncbi:PAS domain-containing protein [Mucilaginibacter achroorhodeus]|uniref:protein-glutamate O-methyltransferase n=1 Tax=Mucilaginibacter achroorhodeus TaxID=2599294 RepID=A0A563U6L0_9SPHI|nr:CheR family methyltransferase [Mucilaginibacter achroorhodeus]TWR26987.1 PAS domain-containing protein [Mucilaginibacter achroorhodeus]